MQVSVRPVPRAWWAAPSERVKSFGRSLTGYLLGRRERLVLDAYHPLSTSCSLKTILEHHQSCLLRCFCPTQRMISPTLSINMGVCAKGTPRAICRAQRTRPDILQESGPRRHPISTCLSQPIAYLSKVRDRRRLEATPKACGI